MGLYLTVALLSLQIIQAREKMCNPEVAGSFSDCFPGYPLSPTPWVSCKTQLRDGDK